MSAISSAGAQGAAHAPRTRPVPRVLSIAGTDPTGGAGIQADLKSIGANGGYGMAVVTALVAQNTQGVRAVHQPPASFLREQLDAVADDVELDAVKIGMLSSTALIETVSAWLEEARPPVIVLDPVMVASSGDRLLDRDAEDAVRRLVRVADLVTPNLAELAVLVDEERAVSWERAIAQSRRLSESSGTIVLVKGGHLDRQSGTPDALVDSAGRLPGGETLFELPGERIETRNTHGTGCSLSAGIATRFAQSGDWADALRTVKAWLADALRHADELEVGHGHGPINHFHRLWPPREEGADGRRHRAHEQQPLSRELSFSQEMWLRTTALRREIDELDFLRRLADGTLDDQRFTFYLAQDALYLRDYSRVLSRAGQLAPSDEEQDFWTRGAAGSLNSELELHTTWLAGRAVGGAGALVPAPATRSYNDFLLARSAVSSYPVLLAAVLPCFWIYADIGRRLLDGMRQQAAAGFAHPYAPWIETYADEGFAAATRQAIAFTDRAAAEAAPAVREAMAEAFLTASAHEKAFFAAPMAYSPPA